MTWNGGVLLVRGGAAAGSELVSSQVHVKPALFQRRTQVRRKIPYPKAFWDLHVLAVFVTLRGFWFHRSLCLSVLVGAFGLAL